MSEVSDLIEKTINPPGIKSPNRRGIFHAIRDVGEKVKADAQTAFNAHFPYLADSKKLDEHATALLIPHLDDDTDDEFRERVATASFFLMRAGERGYILEQLTNHFGDRYILSEAFLNVYVKILDLSDTDREWVHGLLDQLLNPNILLTVAEWFRYVETFAITESQTITVRKDLLDYLPSKTGFRCDGRVGCDQGQMVPCDGAMKCDGTNNCTGWQYKRGTVLDEAKIVVTVGQFSCLGEQDCSGFKTVPQDEPIADPVVVGTPDDSFLPLTLTLAEFTDRQTIIPRCDGTWRCDGSNLASVADAPMTFKITRPFECGGLVMCGGRTCDGSIVCDGTYECRGDAHYCDTEILEEDTI
jgi:hypothetical protein